MKREIVRFSRTVLKFVPMAFFGYLFIIVVWAEFFPAFLQKNIVFKESTTGFLDLRILEAEKTKEIDILFLGSSRSYRHYDTRFFKRKGISSFNLGSSAQTFLQMKVLTKRYIEQLNPQLVVMDVYPGMFESDGVESTLDLILNDSELFRNSELISENFSLKILNSFVFHAYEKIFRSSSFNEEPLVKGPNEYIPGGYVEKDIYFSEKTDPEIKKISFKDEQVKAFNDIVHLVTESGGGLIIIHSPMNSKKKFKDKGKLDSLIHKKNLKFYDLRELHFLKDSLHFMDPMHLNQKGVNLYNAYFFKNVIPHSIKSGRIEQQKI